MFFPEPPKPPTYTTNPNKWLNRAEAAAYLRIVPGTLNNLHVQKRGPVFYKKAGKIYYLTADLDDWIRAGKVPAGGKK